jgi:hypothetical protein
MSRAVPHLHYTSSWRAHERIYVFSFTKIWTLQLKSLFTDDKIWPNFAISLEGK